MNVKKSLVIAAGAAALFLAGCAHKTCPGAACPSGGKLGPATAHHGCKAKMAKKHSCKGMKNKKMMKKHSCKAKKAADAMNNSNNANATQSAS